MTSHEINTTKEPCNTFNQKTPEKEVLIPGGSIPEESKNQCILSNESNSTENIEAKLDNVNDEFITLIWSAREPKKIGKGKETVEKRIELPYSEIKVAIVTVTF